MKPLISIIIPAYNASKYIVRAVDSVLIQTYTNIQIIIVDDGSTDCTLEKIKKYSDNSLVTLHVQVNSGVSAARNKAINSVNGEFIAFLDADDYWHPNKLAIQYEQMQKNPNWQACCTKFSLDARLLRDNALPPASFISTMNLQQVFQTPYLCTSSFMIKTETMLSLGNFDETLETAEDIDIYLKVATKGSIGKINAFLVFKDDVEGSLGAKTSSYQDLLNVLDSFLTDNQSFRLANQDLIKRVKKKIYLDWITDLVYQKKPLEALSLIKATKFKYWYFAFVPLILKSAVLLLIKPSLKEKL